MLNIHINPREVDIIWNSRCLVQNALLGPEKNGDADEYKKKLTNLLEIMNKKN